MNFLQTNFSDAITIVSGLPRSGTSMMMQMLDAGGVQLLVDGIREADVDNPKGYYEFERVKGLRNGDIIWLHQAKGKCVKVISALLFYLPSNYKYQVIFMRRDLSEVLASQARMLKNRGEQSDVSDATMADLFSTHVAKTEMWLQSQQNVKYINVDYNALINDPPTQVHQVNQFLGGWLNEDAMIAVVDTSLYRQRSSSSPTSL